MIIWSLRVTVVSRGVAAHKSLVPTSKKTKRIIKKTNWLLLFVETIFPFTGNHTKHINIISHDAEGLDFKADVIKWLIKNSDSFTFTHNSQKRNV
jgi:hypothetical protein